MQTELEFQKKKRLTRLLEAGSEERLIDKDLTPNLQEAIHLYQVYKAKVAEEYGKRKSKLAIMQQPPTCPLPAGETRFA